MKYIKINDTELSCSQIALGCMRISKMDDAEIDTLIDAALASGINFFDHADIYGGGVCEEKFGAALKRRPGLRDKLFIQTKCGIRKDNGTFDFSKTYILEAVNGSLSRLGTDHVDVLLLHRPDALMEPEEVAAAFDELFLAGKVRYFGVSNQNPGQIALLKKYVRQPICINQLQFSIMHSTMLDAGIHVNMGDDAAINRDGGVLDYCRLNDITIQPWSPFQYGFFEGVFLDNPKFPELNAVISKLAEKYAVSNSAIAVAWILRHPAKMQPIIGSANHQRVRDICKASDFELTREEWYEIYRAAGNILP